LWAFRPDSVKKIDPDFAHGQIMVKTAFQNGPQRRLSGVPPNLPFYQPWASVGLDFPSITLSGICRRGICFPSRVSFFLISSKVQLPHPASPLHRAASRRTRIPRPSQRTSGSDLPCCGRAPQATRACTAPSP